MKIKCREKGNGMEWKGRGWKESENKGNKDKERKGTIMKERQANERERKEMTTTEMKRHEKHNITWNEREWMDKKGKDNDRQHKKGKKDKERKAT